MYGERERLAHDILSDEPAERASKRQRQALEHLHMPDVEALHIAEEDEEEEDEASEWDVEGEEDHLRHEQGALAQAVGTLAAPPMQNLDSIQTDFSAPAQSTDAAARIIGVAPRDMSHEQLQRPPRWGVFSFSLKQAKGTLRFGGYEVTCPFHKKNSRTLCKKFIALEGREPCHLRMALTTARFWASEAPKHTLQWSHVRRVDLLNIPPEEEVERRVIVERPYSSGNR